MTLHPPPPPGSNVDLVMIACVFYDIIIIMPVYFTVFIIIIIWELFPIPPTVIRPGYSTVLLLLLYPKNPTPECLPVYSTALLLLQTLNLSSSTPLYLSFVFVSVACRGLSRVTSRILLFLV